MEFLWVKTSIGENDSSGIVSSLPGCSRAHTIYPTPLQRTTKLTTSRWFYWFIKTFSSVKNPEQALYSLRSVLQYNVDLHY